MANNKFINYNFIVNPLTNRKVSIHSRKAIEIIKNYINHIGGAPAQQGDGPVELQSIDFILEADFAEALDEGGEGNERVGYTFDISGLIELIEEEADNKVEVIDNSHLIGQYTGPEEDTQDRTQEQQDRVQDKS